MKNTDARPMTLKEKARCLKCKYMIGIEEAISEYGATGPTSCPRCGFSEAGGWPSESVSLRVRISLRTVCDAACARARNTDCLCSCGGANHGAAA